MRSGTGWATACALAGILGMGEANASPAAYAGASGNVFDFDNFLSVADAPVTYGVIGTTASFQQPGGPLGQSFISAVARYDGFIATAARVSAAAGGVDMEWTAHTQFRDTYTNNSAAAQRYAFDFDIFAMSLRISDMEGLQQSAEIFAQVQVNKSDGTAVALFRIDEIITGGRTGVRLSDMGTYVPNMTFSCGTTLYGGGCSDFNYVFDPYHGTIDLGEFAAGDTFVVQYDLSARARAKAYGFNGAAASIGDPFHVTGSGVGGTVRAVAPVPLPPSVGLLGAGLAMMRRARRRRMGTA